MRERTLFYNLNRFLLFSLFFDAIGALTLGIATMILSTKSEVLPYLSSFFLYLILAPTVVLGVVSLLVHGAHIEDALEKWKVFKMSLVLSLASTILQPLILLGSFDGVLSLIDMLGPIFSPLLYVSIFASIRIAIAYQLLKHNLTELES